MDGAGVTEVILQFFVLPFVVIFFASLFQMGIRYRNLSGDIPWFDTQREAYISLVLGAIVTVVVTLMIGGPEIFVLFWRPLITTVIMLPIAFGAALLTYGIWHRARR
jgi:hypothetical protein|tara:strand:+ start:531 stop:851 length:321 start_codon:yes stop_codon:yes gene_type:complete